METKLPYVVQPGSIKKILEKIRDAKTPDRFTSDFLDKKLGFHGGNDELDVRLAYSINLVLPKTDDPAVFNAIFKALREHLLRK